MMGGAGGFGGGRSMVQPGIPKPNPYVIAETKNRGDEPNAEVTFKYPRSKIFVGGLDFKLTVEELRHHFQQYGEVVDACILKDIYTGQSRGFGFVTFKEEDVAQDLIHNIMVTTINGRKADIKTAEVKQAGSGGGTIRMGGPGFSKPGFPS
jgi:RNA recognition motif-containing protein